MRHRFRPSAALLAAGTLLPLAAGALLVPVAAGANRYGDLTVNSTSMRSEHWTHGYNEHTFLIQNHSPHAAHRVRIEVPATSYGHNSGISRMHRSADVPPGATVQLSMPQPPMELFGSDNATLFVDGVRQRVKLAVGSLATGCDVAAAKASVLVSRSFATDALRMRTDGLGTKATTHARHLAVQNAAYTRAESDPPQWSAAWLNYTRYDAVLLSASEWTSLPAAIREALERYVAAGGTLAVVGGEPMPAPLTSFFPPPDGRTQERGLGRVLRFASPDAAQWSEAEVSLFYQAVSQNAVRWVGFRNGRNDQFTVVEGLRIPVRGIYLLLVAFALFIGPVMMVVLARRDRRIWLYWIAPTVSLATCAVIFVHALLSEGTRPTVRTEAVVMLDQESRLAVSLATTGFYCPMTPAGGLSFGAETEVTPLLAQYTNGRRTIDWTTRQHFDSGWVLSRIPALFLLRSVATRHERLDWSQTAGGDVAVVNGLGAPIRRLRLADAQGRLHTADGVPPGGGVTLRAEPALATSAGVTNLAQLTADAFYAPTAALTVTNVVNAASLPVPPPGHYIAVLDGAPFTDYALPSRAHRKEVTLLCGRLATPR